MVDEEPDNDGDASGFERRTFLRTTGAAGLGAVVATGTEPVAAAPTGTPLGTTHVVEVGVEHVDVPAFPTNEEDPLTFSTVDLAAGRFTLGLARQADVETFRRQNAMAVAGGYRPLPATVFDAGPRTELTVETNGRLRPMATLPTASPYRRPAVRVTPGRGESVTAAVDGRTVKVEPGSRETIRADPREVTFLQPRDLADDAGHAGDATASETGDSAATEDDAPRPMETTAVTPVVTVQNYGPLETYVRAIRNGSGRR